MEVGQWTKMKQTCKSTKVIDVLKILKMDGVRSVSKNGLRGRSPKIWGNGKKLKSTEAVISVEKMSKLTSLMDASFARMWLYVGIF